MEEDGLMSQTTRSLEEQGHFKELQGNGGVKEYLLPHFFWNFLVMK